MKGLQRSEIYMVMKESTKKWSLLTHQGRRDVNMLEIFAWYVIYN
jgi:hypothetical protein